MCPIFVGSVDNFGRSKYNVVKKYLLSLDSNVISYAARTKNLEWYLTAVLILQIPPVYNDMLCLSGPVSIGFLK